MDESAGRNQSYVEDCQVCCKPNVLRISYDPELEEYLIAAEISMRWQARYRRGAHGRGIVEPLPLRQT